MANDAFVDQPVSATHVGWVSLPHRLPTAEAPHSTTVDTQESPSSQPPTYRMVFDWSSQNAAEQWISEFMEGHYEILGCLAHAVALVAEDIRPTTFTVRTDSRSSFETADDSDESLGF